MGVPGDPADVRRLRDTLARTCAVACDPDWTMHRARDLARGDVREVGLSPGLWRQYARSVPAIFAAAGHAASIRQ